MKKAKNISLPYKNENSLPYLFNISICQGQIVFISFSKAWGIAKNELLKTLGKNHKRGIWRSCRLE